MRTILAAAMLACGLAAPALADMPCDAFVALDTDGQEHAVAAAQADMAQAQGGMMAQGMMAANDPAAATPYDVAMAVADMCAGNPQMTVTEAMGMAPQ